MKDKLFIKFHVLLIVLVLSGCGGKAITYDSAFQAHKRGDTQRALELYTKLLDDGKYANKAHFQIAKIYKSQAKWVPVLQSPPCICHETAFLYHTYKGWYVF